MNTNTWCFSVFGPLIRYEYDIVNHISRSRTISFRPIDHVCLYSTNMCLWAYYKDVLNCHMHGRRIKDIKKEKWIKTTPVTTVGCQTENWNYATHFQMLDPCLLSCTSSCSFSSTFTVISLRGNVELSGILLLFHKSSIDTPLICPKVISKIFSHFSRKLDNVKLQNTVSFLEYYHFYQSGLFETYTVCFLTMWYHVTEIWRFLVAGDINKL